MAVQLSNRELKCLPSLQTSSVDRSDTHTHIHTHTLQVEAVKVTASPQASHQPAGPRNLPVKSDLSKLVLLEP